MRIFLITFAVSIFETIVLWTIGLAYKIWPAHPFLAITVIVAVSAIVIQSLLSHDTKRQNSRPPRQA